MRDIETGEHAVVLGGGIAGLFAARILADHCAAVTVVERDRLTDEGIKRRGVPQGQHSHGLLMRAADIAESRFPGHRWSASGAPGGGRGTDSRRSGGRCDGPGFALLRLARIAGLPTPREDQVPVDIGYATCHFRLPLDAVGGDRVILVGPTPTRPRGFGFAAQEGDMWVLSAFGVGRRNHPPTTPGELLNFAAEFAHDDVAAVLRRAAPIDEVATYRFKTAVWRRYELLDRPPGGILSIGDAVCCFNPIYGNGMTVAAITADLLDEVLRRGTGDLPRRYYRRVGRMLRTPWWLTKFSDIALPSVPVGSASAKSLLHSGMARVFRAAAHDPATAATFLDVLNMDKSPVHMMAPRVAAATIGLRRSSGAHG
ncbi:FAD-dependent monooxygenase family protein [Nocardia thraciensis]